MDRAQFMEQLEKLLSDISEAERQEALESFYQCYPEGGYYASSSSILVSDAYTLANSDARAQTVRLLYPFVSSLNSLSSPWTVKHWKPSFTRAATPAASRVRGRTGRRPMKIRAA